MIKTKLRLRIRTRMTLVLLGLSVLPLILLIPTWFFVIKDLTDQVEKEVIKEVMENFRSLAGSQAANVSDTIGLTVLDTSGRIYSEIENEMNYMAQRLSRIYSGNSSPDLSTKYSVYYSLAPDVSIDSVRDELKQSSQIDEFLVSSYDKLYDRIPALHQIYIATESGIFRQYPFRLATDASPISMLDSSSENDLKPGRIPPGLREEFESKGIELSPDTEILPPPRENEWLMIDLLNGREYSVRKSIDELRIYNENPSLFSLDSSFEDDLKTGRISTGLRKKLQSKGIGLAPGTEILPSPRENQWLIRLYKRVCSIREEEGKLNVYKEYDARIRPWWNVTPKEVPQVQHTEGSKFGRSRPVWSRYVDWTPKEFLFGIDERFEADLNNMKFTPDLVKEFENEGFPLSGKARVSGQDGIWQIEDRNPESYYIGYDKYSIRKGEILKVYNDKEEELFDIELGFEEELNNEKITSELFEKFKDKGQPLSDKAEVLIGEDGIWYVGNNYTIKRERGLNVYDAYVLTCSRAVFNQSGEFIGVVAADVTSKSTGLELDSILQYYVGKTGKLFLMDEQGSIIYREKDMFVPPAEVQSITTVLDSGDSKRLKRSLQTYSKQGVQEVFRANGISLSQDVNISKTTETKDTWLVLDKSRTSSSIYVAERKGNILAVMSYSRPLGYSKLLTITQLDYKMMEELGEGKIKGVLRSVFSENNLNIEILTKNLQKTTAMEPRWLIEDISNRECYTTGEENGRLYVYRSSETCVDEKGKEYCVAYAPISSPEPLVRPNILGIVTPEKNINDVMREMKLQVPYDPIYEFETQMGSAQKVLIGFFFVVLSAVVWLAYKMVRKITRPILELSKGAETIGSGDLDYRIEVRTGDEIEDLANAFNKMTGELNVYVEKLEQNASELKAARRIQSDMLPKEFPPFPDRKEFDIFATMEPAREVGGDFYDFFLVDERKLCFLVGDVSEKGVPASLFMAITKTLLKREGLRGYSPDEMLSLVNNALCPGNEANMFVTVFCVILDTETGEIEYSNAGHNPPLVCTDGEGFEFIEMPEGFVLGPLPDMEFQCKKLALKKDGLIFLYTDGVTEAMNQEEKQYSDQRLKRYLSTMKGKSLEDIIQGVREDIEDFAQGMTQSDDITMLALKYNGKE